MSKAIWTKEELMSLYKLKYEKGMNFEEIGKELNKSSAAAKRKFERTNWDSFIKNPDSHVSDPQRWTQEEMLQLDAFIRSKKSYAFIAEQMGRSYTSVERKAQQTNWDAWRIAVLENKDNKSQEEKDKEASIDRLIKALRLMCRDDCSRLKDITKDDFARKINVDCDTFPISFTELKQLTIEKLDEIGLGNPDEMSLGEGVYVIVGDSHGKHTKSRMFGLLQHVNRHLKPKNIIHIGHIFDDNSDISYHWGDFDNIIVLAKSEELKEIQNQRTRFNFHFDVVRSEIILGNSLYIMNQDMIADYVTTSIRSLDSKIFGEQVIVNCHRMETTSKSSEEDARQYLASPGTLSEPHVISTIRQIDFTDDKSVKQAFTSSFSKYRRMKHLTSYWTQGILIVNVDKNGDHTIIPCPIKKFGRDFAISYFDKIITSDGVRNPSKKIFINADIHSPSHDADALSIQEQVVNDYKPDIFVNLGDSHNFYALNHWKMDKGKVITSDFLKESAQTFMILERMRKWAPEAYTIRGNHERFGDDFTDKFPQLSTLLDFEFVCGLEQLKYKVIAVKDVLNINSAKFIHGDMMMYGQTGTLLEKAARVYTGSVFLGHIHYPSIRFGALSIGCSSKFDQEYNEPNASAWLHGFGLCNQYKGENFPTTVAITNGGCIINGKTYNPVNSNSWNLGKYKVEMTYKFN